MSTRRKVVVPRIVTLLVASGLASTALGVGLLSFPDPSFGPAAGAGGDSMAAILSADGRSVAFASTAQNLVSMTNRTRISGLSPYPVNVFLRDRLSQTTTLISLNLAGTGGGNGNSFPAGISSNNQLVLFESTSSDLVSGDTNSASDVFLRDLASGTTRLISVNTNGRSGNAASRKPVMSPDGRYVAFVSSATDLVSNDTNGIPDVFVRDTVSGTTALVSSDARSTAVPYSLPANGSGSESPVITPDGRFVAFYSSATNLVPGVSVAGEIYVRDVVAGTTTWASTNARSLFGSVFSTTNAVSCSPCLSGDGQYAAFLVCSNFPTGLYSAGLILRHHLPTGVTDVVHTNANVPQTPYEDIQTLDMTPDGRFLTFVDNYSYGLAATSTCVLRWDAQLDTNLLVSANLAGEVTAGSSVNWPGIDASGHYVVFHSTATDLTTNASAGVFVRDIDAGTTRMVNVNSNGVLIPANWAAVPALSGDGSVVAFESPDADGNGQSDILARDLAAGGAELISVRHPDLPSLVPYGSSGFSTLSVSADGLRVAFTSEAANLVPGDTNGYRDVFVRDVLNGTNILVSVGTTGAPGSGLSTEPSISGDGRYVAFSSTANNLVPGDTNKVQDVFVRDLQAGTTLMVSVSTNGGPGNYDSYSPQISMDGRRVLFRSKATNLAPNLFGFGSIESLFYRDLPAGTTYALTTGGVSGSLPGGSMTPDGRFVAVVDSYLGDYKNIYLWDAESGSRVLTNSQAYIISCVSLSPDASKMAYLAGSGMTGWLFALDVAANTNWIINPGYPSANGGIQFSRDGRCLTYSMAASIGGIRQVYLYDFQTRSNQLISRRYTLDDAGSGSADSPAISPDGRFIAYRSGASNSIPDDFNEVPDLFVYDRLQDATMLVTISRTGSSVANQRSLKPVFSGDSSVLVFQSWASDFLNQDFNLAGDVFAVSLAPAHITDTDADGLDDQWELDHFGSLERDGTGDFDGDGDSDGREFMTGTNPSDPASLFRASITHSGTAGSNPSITWPIAPGRMYRVQFKSNLGDPVWQDLNSSMILSGDTGYLIDLAPAGNHRFYRVLLIADADADGLDDLWEMDHFGTLSRDGAGDYDGDGATDRSEYLAGTDPTDGTSALRAEITYAGTVGEQPLITWRIAPGRTYQAQFKNDLADPAWQDLSGTVSVVSNTASVYDLAPAAGHRFYRILLNP